MTIVGSQIPDTVCLAAKGRSVTEIVQHEALTSDMIVIEMESRSHGIARWVEIRLKLPVLGIDLSSGELSYLS